jgi:hypothetical protein
MGTFENGQTEDDIIEGLHRGTLEIPKNPPFRDTVAVPASGYTVIRILATNPGKFKELIIAIETQIQLSILSSSPSSQRAELTCAGLIHSALFSKVFCGSFIHVL